MFISTFISRYRKNATSLRVALSRRRLPPADYLYLDDKCMINRLNKPVLDKLA